MLFAIDVTVNEETKFFQNFGNIFNKKRKYSTAKEFYLSGKFKPEYFLNSRKLKNAVSMVKVDWKLSLLRIRRLLRKVYSHLRTVRGIKFKQKIIESYFFSASTTATIIAVHCLVKKLLTIKLNYAHKRVFQFFWSHLIDHRLQLHHDFELIRPFTLSSRVLAATLILIVEFEFFSKTSTAIADIFLRCDA